VYVDSKAVTVTMNLPHSLSTERERELGLELAEHTYEIQRLRDVLATIQAEHKKMIKNREDKVRALSEVLHQGVEMRPVACERVKDLASNRMITRRLDSGEVVAERALEPAEVEGK
jgi:hypothetical protein